jgi:Aspartyl/Asparaginyl beta-hydroxylase
MPDSYQLSQDFVARYKDLQPAPVVPDNGIPSHNWVMCQSRLPWLEIKGLDLPYNEMLAEAQALRDRFVVHRDNCGRGWRSLCVHGTSAEHTDAPSAYGLTEEQTVYRWTDIQDRCPVTVNTFKNLFHYTQYLRVRFMLVEPGGYITPHVDADNFKFGAINISLNNPDGCCLVTELGTVPFRDSGSAMFLNTSYQHAVWNNSNTDRIHMIVHGTPDHQFWNKIVVDSFTQSPFNSKSNNSHSQAQLVA